jgi:hypothetical protein
MRTQKGEDDAGDSELSFYASSMQISPEQTLSVLPLSFWRTQNFLETLSIFSTFVLAYFLSSSSFASLPYRDSDHSEYRHDCVS